MSQSFVEEYPNHPANIGKSPEKRETWSHRCYTIYDVKAEAYLLPFFQTKDGLAIRVVEEAVNDGKHQFCKYPEDYSLWRIGSYDEQSGTLVKDTPVMIIKCMELIRSNDGA